MRVILLFLARVSVSLRRLSNRNPTAEPIRMELDIMLKTKQGIFVAMTILPPENKS